MTDSPPASVLDAFGANAAPLSHLPGGEGRAWRAGDLVLKPEREPDAVISWLATSVEAVENTADFRLARHVAAGDGRYVVDGWAATLWLEGEHGIARWEERLAASRAFHGAIASVPLPPDDLPWAETWWRIAHRVAWGVATYAAPANVAVVLERLQPLTSAAWTGASPQIMHGDIGNNVLFADGQPPAVIDMSPSVHPPEYANAIAVADAIAWEDAPLTLAFRFTATVEHGDQLLARALVFRLVTAAEAFAALPERVAAEIEAYRGVLSGIHIQT